ncbi:hypothetical protein FHU40_000803 [Nocardioides soli]|uniref:Uncharacterized protein n=1 Tax=Nocardioides soli TaxID=1036020 RepID=A0A7W4VSI7_9ACTN|nr:hypothetical protein [Nocardioides soli]
MSARYPQPAGSAVDELRDIKAKAATKSETESEAS